jgi:hypothetical protein
MTKSGTFCSLVTDVAADKARIVIDDALCCDFPINGRMTAYETR